MPRKTKEQSEKINDKKSNSSKVDNTKKSSIIDKIKQSLNIVSPEEEKKDKVIPKSSTKKTNTKVSEKKSTSKKATIKKDNLKSTEKKTSSKKVSLKKDDTKPTEKKNNSKKATAKKDNLKSTEKKTSTKKTSLKSSTKKETTKKSSSKTAVKKAPIKQKEKPLIVEYYDLPYRYNQTLVKLLYQTPTTLFVYWDISDNDRENYKHIYGENFFEITKPVLIIHNLTLNYSTEIDINDFANSWYINVNDSNCEYIIELGRRPIYYNAEIKEDYIYISKSNDMTIPNDRILFNIDILDSLYFRNVKTNENKYVKLTEILKKIDSNNFPLINFYSLNELYKALYGNENIEEIYNLNNPSSGNPSSGSLSSRFL